MVWTGASTMNLTPTAAARWKMTAPVDMLGEHRLLRDGFDRVVERRPRPQVLYVADQAGREVVEDEDLVPGIKQRFRQKGPDEARSAGDQDAHR